MDITLPDLPEIVEKLLPLTSTFDRRTQTIAQWVEELRNDMERNLALTNPPHPDNVKVLAIFLRDLLSRRMRGERSQRIYDAFVLAIRTEDDLTEENYCAVLREAHYGLGSMWDRLSCARRLATSGTV